MCIVLYPYWNVGLLLPGGIIQYEISHYQFVLTRLLLSSFYSSISRKPLTKPLLMAARTCATSTPTLCAILSIVTLKNIIADKAHSCEVDLWMIEIPYKCRCRYTLHSTRPILCSSQTQSEVVMSMSVRDSPHYKQGFNTYE